MCLLGQTVGVLKALHNRWRLRAVLEVVEQITKDKPVRIDSPEEIEVAPCFPLHLMVHPRHHVGQPSHSVEDIPWFCKVVIVTPVECHRGSHFGKVIQWWFSVLMVLHIQTVTAPVKSMETRVSLLLGVV